VSELTGRGASRLVARAVSAVPWPLVKELARYGFSCGLVLALKLGVMALCLQVMSPLPGYVVVHVVTFLGSYLVHTTISFAGAERSWRSMGRYLQSVLAFKLLDYLVFSVVLVAFDVQAMLSVVIASMAILLLRFLVVRRVLRGGGRTVRAEPLP